MEKQNFFAPILLAALGLAFAIICMLLYFNKNHSVLIKRKLKLGAAILSITSFLNTGVVAQEKMCYKTSVERQPTQINLNENQFFNGNYFFEHNDTIKGRLLNADKTKEYTYSIKDTLGETFSSGKIIVRDSLFYIPLRKISLGEYLLNIYESEKNSNEKEAILQRKIEVVQDKRFHQNTCYFF